MYVHTYVRTFIIMAENVHVETVYEYGNDDVLVQSSLLSICLTTRQDKAGGMKDIAIAIYLFSSES